MDILPDIVHSVDYGVLAYILRALARWSVRHGLEGVLPAGQLWCCLDYACRTAAVLPANTPRAGAAMLIALGVGFLLGNVFLKGTLSCGPRPFVTTPT